MISCLRSAPSHRNPIKAATKTRKDTHEYGRHSLITTESFGPSPLCATSPCFTIVIVAAGTSVIVMGPLRVVVPVGVLMIVGPVVVIHPFGEQELLVGQHPPPSSSRHSKYEGRHFGSAFQDASHTRSASLALQQYILDGVRDVERQVISTGQQMSYILSASIPDIQWLWWTHRLIVCFATGLLITACLIRHFHWRPSDPTAISAERHELSQRKVGHDFMVFHSRFIVSDLQETLSSEINIIVVRRKNNSHGHSQQQYNCAGTKPTAFS